jgi:hypothetical protein
MNNLFYPELVNNRKYNRDSKGRFSDRKDGRIDFLECEVKALKQTIQYLMSVITGHYRIIRMKDEELNRFRNGKY